MYQQDLSNLITCLKENGRKINETWIPGNMLRERIREIEALWHTRFHSGKDTPEISALRGFYEEIKSTYDKMLWACDENNYEQAFFVGICWIE